MDEEIGQSNTPIRDKTFVKDYPITQESEAGKSDIFRRQGFLTSTETQEETAEALPRRLEHIVKEEGQFADDEQEKDYISHQRTVQILSEESKEPQDTDSSDSSTRKKSDVLEGIELKYKDAKTMSMRLEHIVKEEGQFAYDELEKDNISHQRTVQMLSEESEGPQDIDSSDSSTRKKSNVLGGIGLKYKDAKTTVKKMFRGKLFKGTDDEMQNKIIPQNKPSNLFEIQKKEPLQKKQYIQQSETKKKSFPEFQDLKDSMSAGSSNENSDTKSYDMPLKRKSPKIFKTKEKYALQPKQNIELSEEKKCFPEFQNLKDSSSEELSSENSMTKLIKIPLKNKLSNIFIKKKKYVLKTEEDIEISGEKKEVLTEFQDDSMPQGSSSEDTKHLSLPKISLKSKSSKIFRKKEKYTLQPKQDIELSEAKKQFFTEFQDFTDSMSEKSSSGNSDIKSVERPLKSRLSDIFRKVNKYVLEPKGEIKISREKKKKIVDAMPKTSSSEDTRPSSLPKLPLEDKSSKIFRKKEKYALQPKQDIELSEAKKQFVTEFHDFTDSMSEKSSSGNSDIKSVERPLKSSLSDIFRKENKYVLEPKEDIKMSKEKGKKVIDSMSEESSNEKLPMIDIKMFNKKKNFPEFWDLVDSMSEESASEDSNSLAEMPSKGDSPEIFRKNEKYNLPTNKIIEISKEKKGNINELQNFTDSVSTDSNNANIKPETVMVEKNLKSPISFDKSQFPSATSDQLKDIESKCLVKSSTAYMRPIASNAADVRSEKEVWDHFKQHLRSNKSYSDKAMVDSSNMKASALIPKSTSELSHAIKKTDYVGKQRIVYDERREPIRNWILEQIKDKETVMKSELMEGRHSRYPETIRICIAKARNLQSQIDRLFDTLDDQDRSESIPKKSTGFWKSSSEKNIEKPIAKSLGHSPSARAKRIKHSRISYDYIDSYSKLFRYLCRPLSCRSENEKILKRINPISFRDEYTKYWINKEKTYREGIKLTNDARSTVDNFCQSLKRFESTVKSKIPLPDTGTLADFQNHIINLRGAVEENLDCLNTLIPLATAAVISTMNYLCLSEKKICDIHVYLREKQPYLISRSEHETFFDNFLQRHFKLSS